MFDRKKKLEHLLKLEVVDKSFASTIAFAAFSIFSFFYSFGCHRFELVIKITSVCIFLVSLFRLYFCYKIDQTKSITPMQWRALQSMIWMNALSWSIILNFASFELKIQGPHFIVVTTIIAGFIGSSIVTLSYFPSLFVPFQSLLLVPQVFIVTYFYIFEHINLLPLIFLYLMYLCYQLKQYRAFRKEIIKRFIYQFDLEIANEKLQASKDELIEQTVKLVHVSRLAAIGEMSAGIAHEINNPLMIMRGGAQLIEKNISRENIDKELVLKQAQRIQNSVDRVNKIVQGLKSFSNFSDNNPMQEVPLKEIIEDTFNFCTEVITSQGIRLKLNPIPDSYLKCHPVQISQVLINVLKNAADEIIENNFSEDDRWIQIMFDSHNSNVSISVSNGGPKIKDDLSEKIFTPFFTTKSVGKGTGLGLSISQKIMREHGGDLTLDSSRAFTTFVISHPLLSV